MAQIDFDRVAALDLAKHLDNRIATVLQDFMNRCHECGLSYEEATVKAVTVLGHYFVLAAGDADATEPEFLATCQWHYRRMKPDERPNPTANSNSAERRRVS